MAIITLLLIHFCFSAYDYIIPAMDKAIVKTDIQIALPSGYYGRVAPRSGLAAKYFIDVGAGVVDEDYRGNVGVVLFNFNKDSFEGESSTPIYIQHSPKCGSKISDLKHNSFIE
ncbi:deoxyuridine 5'-triphosphate nucleotidohydrolase, mitochondrial [Acipenser oxyrinchus oxyrinchus]|uniref:Deoxyuridine 5'-triphosphate nucleotidohydrolase n=1 Tax=Acipenser oxyrinchus oxyrinchus TaxID=40147 RepID=A0AAD8CEF1_ACIOX|nr:deoxyuridine 5'-triphosphate nucleotidohydrolase, mitochondrial [Acipenser oxyrinchus oxyrinchus]KAK1144442.1 deoxyuridine 5'-triphosphate nucleotidohydrolase, mitochondrial [Acipenser oxyrinchus oxyrinchus]